MLEVKGIIHYRRAGRKYINIVVVADRPHKLVSHPFGVDVKVDRGRIITFLASMYSVRPGDIVWPSHIEPEFGGL